ncbi:MAG: FHA domain-containing protein [Verrucomicrobiaceae bacterium]
MKISFKSKSLAALLGMALLAVNAAGADFIIDRDKVEVAPAPPEAKFTVRLNDIAEVTKIQATVGGKEVVATHKPANEGKTLVYYVIDVSEQNGVGFAKEASEAVKAMADSLLADDKARTLFQVGIGTIGSKHKNFAFDLPTQEGRAAMLEKAAKEKDPTSEIYRCALEALEQFKGQQGGERKVLYILSSGKSTDTDKTRNTASALITAANKEGIAVYAVGFSKNATGVNVLQELQSVAKETAGGYSEIITSNNSRPGSPNAELYGRLKASVTITVDLKDAPGGKQPLVVNLDLNIGKKVKIEKEIDVPSPDPHVDPTTKATPATQGQTPQQSGTQPTPAATPSKITDQPWFLPAVVGGGLLVLGLLAFLIFKATRPPVEVYPPTIPDAPPGTIPPSPTFPNFGEEDEGPTRLVIGWLEEFDKSDQPVARHEITRGNFTIGRSSDSSLRFLDDSVSVHHANIHRRSDRSLEITDLRSANKTRVNGKPVEHCVLKDGDKIELGDIRLKLVLNSSES